MATLPTTLPISQDELFQVVEQLKSEHLSDFASHVQEFRVEQRSEVLLSADMELIKQIDLDIIPETWERYVLLAERLEDETLTDVEHQELILIITQIERANVQRIEAIAKLALLRQVSFDSLIEAFGITNPDDYE